MPILANVFITSKDLLTEKHISYYLLKSITDMTFWRALSESKFHSFGGLTPVLQAVHLPPSSFTIGAHMAQLLLLFALRCPLFRITLYPND